MKKRGIFEYFVYIAIGLFVLSIGFVLYLIFFSKSLNNNPLKNILNSPLENLGTSILFEEIGFLGIMMITLTMIFISLIIFILIVYLRINKLKKINRFNKIRKYSEINPVMDELINKGHEALNLNKLKDARDIYLKIKQIYDPEKDKIISERIVSLYKGILDLANQKNNVPPTPLGVGL